MRIEKCHKCGGTGSDLMPDFSGSWNKPGGVMSFHSIDCPRCMGSGLVEIRLVEVRPHKSDTAEKGVEHED